MATKYVDTVNGLDSNSGDSEALAYQTIQKFLDVAAAGDFCYVEATGNYNETSNIVTGGTNAAKIVLEGYTSTPGDDGQITIDGQSTRASGLTSALGTHIHYVLRNMRITGHTSHGVSLENESNINLVNSRIDNNSAEGFAINGYGFAYKCQFDNNTDNGFYSGGILAYAINCAAFDNGKDGFELGGGIAFIINCLAYGNTLEGFELGGNTLYPNAIMNCTVDGENGVTADGLNVTGAINTLCLNNIFYDCRTGVDSSVSADEHRISDFNLFNANTTDRVNWPTGDDDITGAPLFTNEGAADYTLQSGSPAKAAGVDVGDLINAVAYLDLGPHQRQEPAGGGGGLLTHPGMAGGARG